MDEQLFLELQKELVIPSLAMMLFNLGVAVLLGALVATRPWRRLFGQKPPPREMVHAQLLIALAGAIAVTVIGDSLARAFGLVGLGGFIRFRTGIRDPRDAAVFFLLIGLGMACGLGAVGVALVATAFVAAVVMLLDFAGRGPDRPYLRVVAVANDPLAVSALMQAVLESFPVMIRASNLRLDKKELRFDLENPDGIGAAELERALLGRLGEQLQELSFEQLETLKGVSA